MKSRLGDPKFQEIEFCSVVAPLHVQYANSKLLAAQQIEANAIERARDGCLVDVFYQGARQFEKVLKPQYADCDDDDLEIIFGKDTDDAYELKPTKQWLKPSDALTIKMLEAHNKKYRAHQEIDVNYHGVLRLQHPAEQTKTTTEHAPQEVFAEDITAESEQPRLAIAPPAASAEDFDKMVERGDFNVAPVSFVAATGEETTRQAPEQRPPVDLRKHPRAYDARTLQKPEIPVPEGRVQPLDTAGIGRGKPPPGGFKVA